MKRQINEMGIEAVYTDKVTEKLTTSIRSHAEYLASLVLNSFKRGNVKDIISSLEALYNKAAREAGVKRESALRETIELLREDAQSDAVKQAIARKEKNKGFRKSADHQAGEILYHMDMGTRHIDELMDYELAQSHKEELATISSAIQHLAQRMREELKGVEPGNPDAAATVKKLETKPAATPTTAAPAAPTNPPATPQVK